MEPISLACTDSMREKMRGQLTTKALVAPESRRVAGESSPLVKAGDFGMRRR